MHNVFINELKNNTILANIVIQDSNFYVKNLVWDGAKLIFWSISNSQKRFLRVKQLLEKKLYWFLNYKTTPLLLIMSLIYDYWLILANKKEKKIHKKLTYILAILTENLDHLVKKKEKMLLRKQIIGSQPKKLYYIPVLETWAKRLIIL